MSDSESDVFNFQSGNTTVSARGPNTNLNFSWRSQLTSMPRNFERQRYAESTYDQRSMYYRRETSPMSIHSACDIRPRNFQQYPGRSQKSVFNGRSGSPMSIRTIDSTASVSAADIAFAFKNVKFNKYDLRVIKEAYNKLMKQRLRKRIEKRRNMRLFLKGNRRSGDDSGELGSNSSISSDDCRSVKTSYKENVFSNRSARIELTDFRKTLQDSNLLKDCSDNLKNNSLKNKFSVGSNSVSNTQIFSNNLISKQSNLIPTQKDRFRNGFLLPSQRFNQSVASSVIPEIFSKNNINKSVKNYHAQNKSNECASGSEEDEIFTETIVREKSKRSLHSDDESSLPERKKSKISSPYKHVQQNNCLQSKVKNLNPLNPSSDGFEFTKPILPVRKSKPRIQEKLIAKSSQPLTDFLEPVSNKIHAPVPTVQTSILQAPNIQEKSTDNLTQLDQSDNTQNSDVSMRPSFIKRKLFTQKLDLAEKANLSSDGTNSPLSNGHLFQKEKNKARKLVTNQSCLNREVQDDNNLLDLIHKIVPPDQMNITNQTTINQTKTNVNNKKKKKQDDEDKWDVTSVMSMCNEDDVSDTYTDEEIFEDNCKKDPKKNHNNKSKENPKITDQTVEKNINPQNCKIVLERLQSNCNIQNIKQKQVNNQNVNLTHKNVTQDIAKSSAKSFWDTDFESDSECQTVLPHSYINDNLRKVNATLGSSKQDFKEPIGYASSQHSKKIPNIPKNLNNTTMNSTVLNNTVDSMRKFNSSTLSIRSHRTSKKNKCNQTFAKETPCNPVNYKQSSNKKILDNNHSNTDLQTENSTDLHRTKLTKPNEKQEKKTTSHTKKNPKENKGKKETQVESTKKNNTKKLETKSNIACTSIVSNKISSKSEMQMTDTKDKTEKQTQNTKVKKSKANTNGQKNKKVTQHKSPKNPKLKPDSQISNTHSKNNNPVTQTKSNLNNTVDPTVNTTPRIPNSRPIRSCRTPRQSSSIELSRSQLNTTADANRTLRSRVINLSSSIENITIQIKPRNKTINNKNISCIKNTRVSDVSFSLGSDKATPMSKKNLSRNKSEFFKGRRKN